MDFGALAGEAIHEAEPDPNPGFGEQAPPLVLDLDSDGIELVALEESTAFFDVDGDGFLENTGWVSSDDGILVFDENASGTVDQTQELVLATYADFEGATDLDGLATFDSNGDGVFDASDDEFDSFYVWQDLDQDGVSDDGELHTLAELGIESIGLTKVPVAEADQDPEGDGNAVLNTTTFTMTDGTTGEVGDVSLAASTQGYQITENDEGVELNIEDESRTLLFADAVVVLNIDAAIAGHAGVFGGDGADIIVNSGDLDVVFSGGAGSDRLEGGAGSDWLSGDAGADELLGGAGHDVLFVDADDTLIDGGDGIDIVIVVSPESGVTLDLAASSLEAAFGDTGDDVFDASLVSVDVFLDGLGGDDVLTGGSGNDILSGGEGSDDLAGGAGDDELIVDEFDTFNGGDGVDTVYYTGASDLDLNITDKNVEIIFAGDGNDSITTDLDHATAMYGFGGDDTLTGGWGGDWLGGGTGNDVLNGGYGSDTYYFERGDGQDLVEDDYTYATTYWTWEQTTVSGGGQDAATYEWNYVQKNWSSELDAGEQDILSFGYGVSGDDLLLRIKDGNLETALKDPDNPDAAFEDLADRITISDWNDENRRVEVLNFWDGTEIAFIDLFDETGILEGGDPFDLGAWMEERALEEGITWNDDGSITVAREAGDLAVYLADDATYTLAAATDTADTVSGSDGTDVMVARGGDDTLIGNQGADVIDGGDGEDTLTYLFSESGVDVNLGTGLGADAPAEPIYADDGVTVLAAIESHALGDVIADVENLTGSNSDDVLAGDGGVNRLNGVNGDDVLFGGDGDDTLDGGIDDDVLEGGAGADTLIGGDGSDTASYANATEAVDVNLATGVVSGADALGDTFETIENLAGSSFGDVLTGDANANVLSGGDGGDVLNGGYGSDDLHGGAGSDALEGAEGDDTYRFGVGDGVDSIYDGYVYEREDSYTETYTYQEWEYVAGGQDGDNLTWTQVDKTGTRTVTTTETIVGDGGHDILEFGGDIRLTDIMMRLVDGNLEYALKDPDNPDALFDDLTDRLTIAAWSTDNNAVEEMHFTDGTEINIAAALDAFGVIEGGEAMDIGDVMADLGIEELGQIDGIIVVGTDDSDILGGTDEVDAQLGGAGDDVLLGTDGGDILHGGEGSDTVDYSASTEGVTIDLATGEAVGGYAEGDTLTSIENLVGSGFDDELTGDDTDNALSGGAGDDTLNGAGGADTLDGGAGSDTASYEDSEAGVSVDLEAATATGGDAEGGTLASIENITGSEFDDTLSGDDEANVLDGLGGVDNLIGAAGADIIILGQGTDLLQGGEGDDTYVFGTGDGLNTVFDDYRYDEEYTTTETYTYTVSTWVGGGQDDEGYYVDSTASGTQTVTETRTVQADAGFEVLEFGAGIVASDLLVELDGDDLVIALRDPDNPDATLAELEASGDTVRIVDWMSSLNRVERLTFSDGTQQDVRDIVGYFASDADDNLTWTETAAIIDGGLGDDVLTTGGGTDTLLGGAGNDTLSTGDLGDVLSGGMGDDLLTGGLGNDTIDGGDGTDTAVFSGVMADYDIAINLDGDAIVTGPDGTDTLTTVEFLQFDDQTFALEDMPVISGAVTFTTDEDISFTVTEAELLAMASDPNEDTLSVANLAMDDGEGSITDHGDGSWTIQPAENVNGDISFTYDVADGITRRAAISTVTVVAVDDALAVTEPTSFAISEDGALVVSEEELLANAVEVDGAALSVSGVLVTSGSAVVVDNGNGTWTVTPDAEWSGDVTLGYTITDDMESVVTSAAITVSAINDAPTVGFDWASTNEDTAVTILAADLLANDSDMEGEALSLVSVENAVGGTVALTESGDVAFTPDENFNGEGSFQYTIQDASGALAASIVTVDVTPVDDPLSISGTVSLHAIEDTELVFSGSSLLENISDVDGDGVSLLNVTVDSGEIVGNLDGTYTYAPEQDFSGSVTVSYEVSDGVGTILASATIDVTPVNDAAVIGGGLSGEVAEDSGATELIVQGVLTVTDADAGEAAFLAGTMAGEYGTLTLDAAGNWSYSADNTQDAIQSLGDGSTLTDVFTVSSLDGTTEEVTITITGANDGAVISGVVTGEVIEDAGAATLSTSGVLSIVDTDTGEASFVAETISGAYGGLVIDESGAWSYSADNTQTAIQSLGEGASLVDILTVMSVDGTEQEVIITITGVNDTAVISGDTSGAVTEDDDTLTLTASGTLAVGDTDSGEAAFLAGTIVGTYGVLVMDEMGAWSYSADNTQSAIQSLAAGASLVDVLTVTSSDGTAQDVTITINGVDDGAVISGTSTGSVTEDADTAVLIAAGALSVSDVDSGESSSFVAETVAGEFGDLTIDATGNWSYSADNTQAAVQSLGEGASLVDTLTVTSSDGTEQDVAITITGVDDTAVISGTSTGSVTEDSDDVTLTTTGVLMIVDPDVGEAAFRAETLVGAYGELSIDAVGNWIYTAENAQSAIQSLSNDSTLSDTFTVTAIDGTAQDIVITIVSANDAASLSSDVAVAMTDTAITLEAGSILANDRDADGDVLSLTSVGNPIGGTVIFDDNGDVVFTPTAGFDGVATFEYSATDGDTEVTGQVDVEVHASPTDMSGTDTLYAAINASQLEGGQGDDIYVLHEGSGANSIYDDYRYDEDYETTETYTYTVSTWNAGGGQDSSGYYTYSTATGTQTVTETRTVQADAGHDYLEFGAGIAMADLLFRLDGEDLTIALRDPDDADMAFDELHDTITVADWGNALNSVEALRFADGLEVELQAFFDTHGTLVDGEVFDPATLLSGNDTADGTANGGVLFGFAGDDVLRGGEGNDVVNGGEGDDTLSGGAGDDTYVFNRGDDHDTIDNIGDALTGADSVVFGADVENDQLWFSQVHDDLQVQIIGTDDSILIDDWYLSSDNRVTEFEASDGSVLAASSVDTLVSAMAAFSPPALGVTELSQAHLDGNLDDTIAAAWQAGG